MPKNATRRPDLENIPVQYPDIIGQHIFPFYELPHQSGDLYYQPVNADVTAQSSRNTASVSSISVNTIANAHTAYTLAENIGRIRMSYDQIDSYNGQDGADLALGRMAVRAFLAALETTIAGAVLGNADPTSVVGDIVAGIEDAVADLEDVGNGDVCLAISHANFTALKKDNEVKARMQNTGVLLGAGGDPRNVTAEQLAAILNVRRIYVGANKEWKTGVSAGYRNNAFLFIEPNENMSPVEEAQYGRTLFHAWDSDIRKYIVETFYNDMERACYADCVGKCAVKTLNSGMGKTIQLFASSSSSSSSSL